jgi:hypothetical protein
MREFQLLDDRIETGGGVIDAFLSAFGAYKARGERVVCRHLGTERIDVGVGAFYSAAKFLVAMSELQGQFGESFMRKVGSFIFEKAVFPPGIDSAQKGLTVVGQAYYMNHRNVAPGQIGGYHWSARGDRGGVMFCDNPYPCAFDMGILESIARRFEVQPVVTHAPAEPCRHLGGDACTYEVRW